MYFVVFFTNSSVKLFVVTVQIFAYKFLFTIVFFGKRKKILTIQKNHILFSNLDYYRRRSGSVTEDGCKQSTRRRHHLASSDMSDNSEDSECDGKG